MLMFDPVLPPVVCVCVCVHVCYMQPQDVVKHRGRKWKEEVMDENVPPVKKANLIDSFGTPAYRRREQSKLTCTNELGISYDLTANHEILLPLQTSLSMLQPLGMTI